MRFVDKHTAHDKVLLRFEREHSRLSQALHGAPVVPLETPYQRGWVKTYVLREAIFRRADLSAFQSVLTAVNREIWSRNHAFVQPDGSRYELRPRIISTQEWQRRAWTAAQRRLFSFGAWKEESPATRWVRTRYRLVVGFTVAHLWWLEEEVRPSMVTHRRIDLPEVRGRLAEIEAYMRRTLGWARLNRLQGRSRRWWQSGKSVEVPFRAEEEMGKHI
ncbi:MAG TPA: hypothetical protein PLN52_00370 [Opitutaceae bacterium]|nr:hypothetical protein [Opitutaceae bacterium]